MRMFPHAFFPSFPVYHDAITATVSDGGRTTGPPARLARAIGTRPIKIDVEKAVAVMLATNDVSDDSARQKFRFQIMNAVPAQSIDWDTVNWVETQPFQTQRL